MLCLCAGSLRAQSTYVATPVTISKEKVKFGDKVYYSHVVLEKQTLYSICKAYNVTLEEVYEANADLQLETQGLKTNSIIRIPIHDSKTETKTTEVEVRQQTQESTPADDGEETIHVVKWYEDLESIASKYGVSKEAIMQANGLTEEKLKARTKLVIPTDGTAKSTSPEETVQTEPSPAEAGVQAMERQTRPAEAADSLTFKPNLSFGLILPLNASGEVKTNYMDFYCGALLAARDAQERGLSVDLSVFDEMSDMAVMDSSSFAGMDALIGPVTHDNMEKVLRLVPAELTVVSPLDAKTGALAADYTNLYHSNPSSDLQLADLVDWIKEEKEASDKVIVISQKGKDKQKQVLDSLFEAQGVTYVGFAYDILDGRRVSESLQTLMTAEGTNRVILATDSEAFVIDATRSLSVIANRGYPVVLYGPAKIKRFTTIEIEILHQLNLHMSLSTNVNYKDDKVRDFLMKYRAYFGTEPTELAFCAYDLVSCFSGLISRYGQNWTEYAADKRFDMMMTSFAFTRQGDGGYVNEATRRVVYTPDYELEAVK